MCADTWDTLLMWTVILPLRKLQHLVSACIHLCKYLRCHSHITDHIAIEINSLFRGIIEILVQTCTPPVQESMLHDIETSMRSSKSRVHVSKHPVSTKDHVAGERAEKTWCANSSKISFKPCYRYKTPRKQTNVHTAVPVGHDATNCFLVFKSIRAMLPTVFCSK